MAIKKMYSVKYIEIENNSDTVCPRSLDPFCIVTNYMNWVKT